MRKLLLFFLLAAPAYGQVSVSLSPEPKLQFLSNNGVPLAGGCVFSYSAGTSSPQATYTDSTGLTVNNNPLILDAGGRGSIWLTSQGYKLVLFSAGGVNCATGTQIWSIDGITGQLGLLSLANTWSGVQTFSQPIKITPSVNQIVLGTSPNTTTLNAPAPSGNVVLTTPVTSDTLVGRATTDTLTNKTLTTPTINGVSVVNDPAAYIVMPNNATGTTLNSTASEFNIAGSATAQIGSNTPLATGNGAIGIVVAGAGTTGSATIQQSGTASCVFDGATTAADYVQQSTITPGQCHDAGLNFPSSGGTILGRVRTTNAAGGTYALDLFSPGVFSATTGAGLGCTNFTPVTVVNNNAIQNLLSCSIAANTLSQGSLLDIQLTGIESTASGGTITLTTTLGGGTGCVTQVTAGIANNQPFNTSIKMAILTAGAGGTANLSCEYFSTASGGGVIGPNGIIGTPTISVNTTILNSLLVQVQMSVANPGNSVTGQILKAVVF